MRASNSVAGPGRHSNRNAAASEAPLTVDLFPKVNPLLPWLPGETLFSICSRHDRLWGYRSSAQSAQVLFGRRRLGTQHDLPSGLDEFVARTQEEFGSTGEIACSRTLLRFYRPFLAPEMVGEAVATMRGPVVSHLKFRLGLLTSRFRANHPLKACLACMQADVLEHGWVYWHLEHQFPGVWCCPTHGGPLLVSTVKSTGVRRFEWSLPESSQLICAWDAGECPGLDALLRLSLLIRALVVAPGCDGWLNGHDVQRVLWIRLRERGWCTSAGSIRLAKAAADYLHHCLRLRLPEELTGLPATLEQAKAQLGRVLRPLRTGVHPMRLLVAIDWLFADAEHFTALIAEGTLPIDRGSASEQSRAPAASLRDTRREHLLSLVREGSSATAAAADVGIDVSTAMSWAAAGGFRVGRRPKILKSELRSSLIRALRQGADKAHVAARFGVSVATVTRLLLTEVGLHDDWTASRVRRARRRARQDWLQVQADHPGLRTKLLRAIKPASYAWLYRHDRAWLIDNSPPSSTRSGCERQESVRWDERDLNLSSAVENAVAHLATVAGPKALRLWQIYQLVPALKPKLRVLERLPLTQRALERALVRRPSSATTDDLFGMPSDVDST